MNILSIFKWVSDDTILGVVGALLPIWLGISLVIWLFRLIRTLRERLDSIEDKLELLVLAQEIELAKMKPANETSAPN